MYFLRIVFLERRSIGRYIDKVYVYKCFLLLNQFANFPAVAIKCK